MKALLLLACFAHGMINIKDYVPERKAAPSGPSYVHDNNHDDEKSSLSDYDHATNTPVVQNAAPTLFQAKRAPVTQTRSLFTPNSVYPPTINNVESLSTDVVNMLINQIIQSRGTDFDRTRFRRTFLVRKHIINDGNKKIVRIAVNEQFIPREPVRSIGKSNVLMYVLIGCVVLLIAGLMFRKTVRLCKRLVRRNAAIDKEVGRA